MTMAPDRADFVVLIFPTADDLLKQRVDEILARRRTVDMHAAAAELASELPSIYPRVAVRPRAAVAGFGQSALYVFRDGTAVSHDNEGWISDPSTAQVVSDADGIYIDANESAERLFGVSRSEIVGRRVGEFTRPDARVDAGALWDILERTGRLHSLAVIVGSAVGRRVEFVTIKDGQGPGRHVTYLREHSLGTA
ncbi:MAG: PAS domain-containing protein [Chloroflexota bacterium]